MHAQVYLQRLGVNRMVVAERPSSDELAVEPGTSVVGVCKKSYKVELGHKYDLEISFNLTQSPVPTAVVPPKGSFQADCACRLVASLNFRGKQLPSPRKSGLARAANRIGSRGSAC